MLLRSRSAEVVVVLHLWVLGVLLRCPKLLILLGKIRLRIVLLRVVAALVVLIVLGWVTGLIILRGLITLLVEVPGLTQIHVTVHADAATVVGGIE